MDDGRDLSDYEPPDYEPPDYEPPDYEPPDYEPPDSDPPDPSEYAPDPSDYEPPDYDPEPPDPSDYEPDPADYQPDPSDYEPDERDYDHGPDEPDEFDFEFYKRQIHADAIRQFTGERLQSYYLANPTLAEPALNALTYAQSLLSKKPLAALVFATTSTELAIKTVLLRPIVSGLVHTEGLAGFITDLVTQHTGMERFRDLLTEILAQFGGVDLKTYTRPNSKRTLWQEIDDIQKARNGVIHRGEKAKDSAAPLAVAVAATLLRKIFPLILAKLNLHVHAPMTVCADAHPEPTG
jgi:hypothetical protein